MPVGRIGRWLMLCLLSVGCGRMAYVPGDAEPAELLEAVGGLVQSAGMVRPSGSLKRSFTLRNVSGEKVQLSVVRSSCSCAGAVIDPPELGPGEQAAVAVSIRTTKPGEQRVTLVVKASGRSSEQALSLGVEYAVAGVSADPRWILVDVPRSQGRSRSVIAKTNLRALTSNEEPRFDLFDTTTGHAYAFTIVKRQSRRVPGGWETSGTLEVQLPVAPSTGSAPVSHTATVRVQDLLGELKEELSIVTRPANPLNVTPCAVVLRLTRPTDAPPGSTAHGEASITVTACLGVKLDPAIEFKCAHENIDVRLQERAESRAVYRVSYRGPEPPRPKTTSVEIRSTELADGALVIPCLLVPGKLAAAP